MTKTIIERAIFGFANKLKTLKNKGGFSLIELMIVVVIIGILICCGCASVSEVSSEGETGRSKSEPFRAYFTSAMTAFHAEWIDIL